MKQYLFSRLMMQRFQLEKNTNVLDAVVGIYLLPESNPDQLKNFPSNNQ